MTENIQNGVHKWGALAPLLPTPSAPKRWGAPFRMFPSPIFKAGGTGSGGTAPPAYPGALAPGPA